jgi:transposase InsO family protein
MIPMSMKQMAIQLIEEAVSAGARRRKACDVLGISTQTLRRWRSVESLADARKGAQRRCGHALCELDIEAILNTCNRPEYKSLPPSQIVPRLADKGVYIASESSFYRVLRAQGQNHRRGRAEAPRKVTKPKAWGASAPNQVWSWDITYLPTAVSGTYLPTAVSGEFYRLYMVLDIYSRLIVGWEVHREELAAHAAELIDKACLRHRIAPDRLALHADNGGPMKGATMLAKLQELGVVPSFSRPSVSNDNPYSEAAFKTLKYIPNYPKKPFASLDDARQWVERFVTWYNTEHRHSGIQFVTPQQRHVGEDEAILKARTAVYEAAKRDMPQRWRNRAVRDWSPVGTVWLNPGKSSEPLPETAVLAA